MGTSSGLFLDVWTRRMTTDEPLNSEIDSEHALDLIPLYASRVNSKSESTTNKCSSGLKLNPIKPPLAWEWGFRAKTGGKEAFAPNP